MGERGLHASWQEHFVFQDVDFNNEAIASRSRVRSKMEVFHAIYSLKQRLHTSWRVRLRLLLPSCLELLSGGKPCGGGGGGGEEEDLLLISESTKREKSTKIQKAKA